MTALSDLLQKRTYLFEKNFSDQTHACMDAVKQLILTSDFACRHVQLIKKLLLEDDLLTSFNKMDYMKQIKHLSLHENQNQFSDGLRSFRHRHFFRIYLRELAGLADTESTLLAWSDCAEALIGHALEYCHHQLEERYGKALDEEGNASDLLLLGMGKLGGRELNFSSDIDLIFAFTKKGQTSGPERLSNQEFFCKVVQLFVLLMQSVTANGFVFRVDLRLRPNGESGPLVFSLAAMETYYQEQGRDWERYAMVKARLIYPLNETFHHAVNALIKPFVYRRYVDFSVIESLRSMKAMIEREVMLDPYLNDIKRGKGGIREVEFIIQTVQLIRGGRLPELRQTNALKALAVLKQKELMERTGALRKAYLFLRKVENTLQAANDQQTHALPQDEIQKNQIALAMGYETWTSFYERLQQYQRIISLAFQSILKKVEVYEDDKRVLMKQLAIVWNGHVEQHMAINVLISLGYKNADHCYQMINAFRHSPRCRRLKQTARMRLDRFMVILLIELCEVEQTDQVLLQVMHLLENIVGRSAYLALLTENPSALKELMYWFAHSPFISALVVNQPFLLEIFLDQDLTWQIQTKKQMAMTLKEKLAVLAEQELQEDYLRQFKLMQWLFAARAELYHHYSAVRIGQFLSDVAQVIVTELFELACRQLVNRYPDLNAVKSSFTIVAYGKFGSREMNYNSDLDLVFLHQAQPSQEHLVTRLTQKIVHMLTTRTQAGILYAVDTRLRPSGSAGLLISHFDAFKAYQENKAWTWEHQALLKARLIIADKKIKPRFLELKETILQKKRNKKDLLQDVVSMREKIGKYQDANQMKYAPGGLLDLEFLLQFLILLSEDPAFSKFTHPLTQLDKLYKDGFISHQDYKLLKKTYRLFHELQHKQLLQQTPDTSLDIRSQLNITIKNIYDRALDSI